MDHFRHFWAKLGLLNHFGSAPFGLFWQKKNKMPYMTRKALNGQKKRPQWSKLSKRTQSGPKGPKQSTAAHNWPKGLRAQSGPKLSYRPKVTKIIKHSSRWPKMTKKLASNVSLKVQLATFFMATVCAAVSAIIVLTLIGSSVMDATHLILISPYLKISYSSYSLLRNIFNFQCLYLYNIYKHNTI